MLSPTATAARDSNVLNASKVAADLSPSPEARGLQSEIDLLGRKVEQLRAKRFEPPPTYISRGAM